MLDTNHSSRYGTEIAIADAAVADGIERRQTLEELVLDLLEGEFAGVIRSHVRGEVYGGC